MVEKTPLFKKYPKLTSIPWVSVINSPTPIHKMEQTSKTLKRDIWVKRDDLTHTIYGGNKPRKYELLLSHKALFFRKHKGVVAASIYKATLGFLTAVRLAGWTIARLLPGNHQAIDEKRKLHWYLLRRIPSF